MAKTYAIVFGFVFLILGLLSWVSNPLVGAGALFATSTGLTWLNLIAGILLLVAGFKMTDKAGTWLKVFGVIYALLGILGLLMTGSDGMANILGLLSVNTAGNWLHLILGLLMFLVAWKGNRGTAMGSPMGGQM